MMYSLIEDQKLVAEMEYRSALWGMKELADELLAEAQKSLDEENQGKEKEQFVMIMGQLKQEHAKIESVRRRADQDKKLCLMYRMVARIVGLVDKWTHDKKGWAKVVKETRAKELVKVRCAGIFQWSMLPLGYSVPPSKIILNQ